MGSEYDKLWQCAYCERWWVVPNLARDCEAKHEADEDAPRSCELPGR